MIKMKLYSLREAAKMAGVHPATIRRWADEGKIPSKRTEGGHRRVDISEYKTKPPKYTILERALRGDVITLVVAYKDRLARFGGDIIRFILESNGGKLVVLNEVSLSPEQELTQDLLTILHVFSCRLHGLRKYRTEISESALLSNGGAKSDT